MVLLQFFKKKNRSYIFERCLNGPKGDCENQYLVYAAIDVSGIYHASHVSIVFLCVNFFLKTKTKTNNSVS
jgi:hypothetical protein